MSAGEGQRIVVDLEKAASQFPGDFLREMAALLVASCDKHMQGMLVALEQENAADLKRAAHSIRGDAQHFSAEQVIHLARQIEQSAEVSDFEQARSLSPEMSSAVDRLTAELKSFLEDPESRK